MSWRGRDARVLGLWVLAAGALALARTDPTGDALRHLHAPLEGAGFAWGEPRWILFPGLVYTLVRPWVIAGVVSTMTGAVAVSKAFAFVCGTTYLVALRSLLERAGLDASSRARGLAVAGFSAP